MRVQLTDNAVQVRPSVNRWLTALLVGLSAWYVATTAGVGDEPVWLRVVLAISAVVILLGLLAQRLTVLTADGSGILIKSGLRRRRPLLAWPEIHHFELRGSDQGLGAWTIDGRWVPLLKYGWNNAVAAPAVVALESYRWRNQQSLGLV